jgi:hypothetical protein
MNKSINEILKDIKLLGFKDPFYKESIDGTQTINVEANYIPMERIRKLSEFCEKYGFEFEIINVRKDAIGVEIFVGEGK